MRCFLLPCFGSKIKKSSNPLPPTPFIEENQVEETIHYIAQLNAEVTFTKEVVVKNCEEKAARGEEIAYIVEKKQVHAIKDILDECASDSLFSLSIDSKNQVSLDNVEVNSPMQKLPSIRKVGYEAVATKPEEQPNFISIRVVSKSNSSEESSALEESNEDKGKVYRYHDCCDEGYENVNVDERDSDATFQDDNRTLFQEESSESLFSLSIDSRKRISSAENVDGEVNSLIVSAAEKGRRIEHDDSTVLNPIENIITQQVKMVKATLCKMKDNKENINLVVQNVDVDNIAISPEPNLKLSSFKTRKKQEFGVDTSLSSWLVEPETTPVTMKSSDYSARKHSTPKERRGSSSVLSHEDRPILGALSIEGIRKYSSVSATCSRSRSPDEIPIIGTVGSYWSHTGKCMDSDLDKHRKDARLKCSSTIRKLERTFEDEFEHFPVQ
ncbi:unnamed protein product [Lupinus luteus]|uniref:Uncharacterized protein n=1 Tax=Lupinus luteus TaxID=3873 RepID=A0AAV1WIZ2_LUPLU